MSIVKQLKAKVFQIVFETLIAVCGIILVVSNFDNPLLVTVGIVMAVSALASHICATIALKSKERQVIAKQEKENAAKTLRYYNNIFDDLRPRLQEQINLFTKMFKASADKRPSQIHQDISKFFDANFYKTITRLDYLQRAPISYVNRPADEEVNWVEYIEQEYLPFKTNLENAKKVLHVANLKDDVILKFIDIILMVGNNYEKAAKLSRLQGEIKQVMMASFFLKDTLYKGKSWLELYIEPVVTLAKAHNRICDKKIKVDLHIWEEDYAPRLGSSIKKKEYYRVEQKNGNKYLKEV